MKKKLFFLVAVIVLCLGNIPVNAQTYDLPFVSHTPVFSITQRNLSQVILYDGVYEFLVEYKSNTTNYERYTLEVRIENDNVTHIFFGN